MEVLPDDHACPRRRGRRHRRAVDRRRIPLLRKTRSTRRRVRDQAPCHPGNARRPPVASTRPACRLDRVRALRQAPTDRPRTGLDRRSIWLVHADGSGLHELASRRPRRRQESAGHLADGTQVVFSASDPPFQLWEVGIDGGRVRTSSRRTAWDLTCIDGVPGLFAGWRQDRLRARDPSIRVPSRPSAIETTGVVSVIQSTKHDVRGLKAPSANRPGHPTGRQIVYHVDPLRRRPGQDAPTSSIWIVNDGRQRAPSAPPCPTGPRRAMRTGRRTARGSSSARGRSIDFNDGSVERLQRASRRQRPQALTDSSMRRLRGTIVDAGRRPHPVLGSDHVLADGARWLGPAADQRRRSSRIRRHARLRLLRLSPADALKGPIAAA